jgi:small subunit ribosomal protein S16
MLKMRLQRTGRKNDASFRVVVTDSRRGPKSGNNVDLLGFYNPKLGKIEIDGEKAKAWIAQGVQLSDTMHNMLVSQKIIEGKKINVLPRKSPIIDEEKVKAEAEAKAAAEAAEAEAKSSESDTESDSQYLAAEETAPEAPVEPAAPEAASETPAEPVAEESATEEEKTA